MKYFSLLGVVFLLLFSGCKVDFVSRADNTKIYASHSSCGDDKEQIKEDAVNKLIRNYPMIAGDLKQYVKVNKVKHPDDNSTLCYEAVVTKKGWDRYTRVLQSRQEEITQSASRYEKIIEYDNKDVLIKIMQMERRQFNSKLEDAKRLAPMDIEPFLVDYKSLADSTNVLPSVKIKEHSCNKGRNYDCDVAFMANVNDESTELLYSWDFGEGSKSEKRDPTHRFGVEGNYNILLQVTDDSGLSTFHTKNIVVTKSKVSEKSSPKNSLKAYFLLAKRVYKVNTNVDFDNRSRSGGSKVTSYLWDFGDGKTSTLRNPKHQYKKAGKYVVKYKMCASDKSCAYASTRVKIVSGQKKVKAAPVKKAAVPVATAKKMSVIDAKAGENIQEYIASHGQPSKKIVKKKGTTKAYKFGSVWLLVKYDKIVCAVEEDGFKTTLMGQPKKCNWHKRYAKDYMVDLQ